MKSGVSRLVVIGVLATAVLPMPASAKGPTTRIRVTGQTLAQPVDIIDTKLLQSFPVWAGPGTRSCVGGPANCVEGTEGLIANWTNGPIGKPRSGLAHYEVSFYATEARRPSDPTTERLVYVVAYEYDALENQGYVYLPARGEPSYAVNVATLHRGLEGRWFLATRAWLNAVTPLLSRRH